MSSSSVVVFCGPSLSADEVTAVLPDALVAPPVEMGSIYRACRVAPEDGGPSAIAVIDGYYERRPSVWHVEIMWALSRGVRVYGAASMGALRAAELHPYGMVGVGQVFEWYRDGVIEDDDEVAVVHAPAQSRYFQMSEAFVDVRVTVADAIEAGVVDAGQGDLLLREGKQLFYPYRGRNDRSVAKCRPAMRQPVGRATQQRWNWLSS